MYGEGVLLRQYSFTRSFISYIDTRSKSTLTSITQKDAAGTALPALTMTYQGRYMADVYDGIAALETISNGVGGQWTLVYTDIGSGTGAIQVSQMTQADGIGAST
ncbi:MAG: hypothetical protein K1X39_01170, partial [Thermoflexales bacterium]|nr:hypothetical protein [Thermoflexales bacterium]